MIVKSASVANAPSGETMGNNLRLLEVLERWFYALEWFIIRIALLLLLAYEVTQFVIAHWRGLPGTP